MNRRSFFGTLLVTPTLLVTSPESFFPLREIHPVIDCDLSLTGIQIAWLTGEKEGFGKPRRLLVGPENRFIARELLWHGHHTDCDFNCLREDDIEYEVVYNFPFAKWQLIFDRGIVTSGLYDL